MDPGMAGRIAPLSRVVALILAVTLPWSVDNAGCVSFGAAAGARMAHKLVKIARMVESFAAAESTSGAVEHCPRAEANSINRCISPFLRLRGGAAEPDEAALLENLSLDDKKDGGRLPTCNVVLVGHVDSGKSTISGHLLYLGGIVDQRTLEKFEREAKALGRESWKFAWALDTSDEERAKGKTHEVGTASFVTDARRYVILDAPGHKSFVPEMIGGAAQAEVAVLVVSARKGEFEAGFEKGGQTREHTLLIKVPPSLPY